MQMPTRILFRLTPLMLLLAGVASNLSAAEFDKSVLSVIRQKCVKCHGKGEINGDVDFKQYHTSKRLLGQPQLIERMINAIDDNNMPPEGEPPLDEQTRAEFLATLQTMLKQATTNNIVAGLKIRRLNRFQYNNTVKDLFQLKLDVFGLSEKLMTRYENYLHRAADGMPDLVQVGSQSLNPAAGLRNVTAFPKDLRASHGFDNQADQLTLSPLLLDAFLRLSVSIVESPDFNEQNVGIWNDLFMDPPAEIDRDAESQRRLALFLRTAFRGPVDNETLQRYAAYASANMEQGLSFSESMKKVVSAVLSSPHFLYRSVRADASERQFELASNLSYFLWGSCPDEELLRLAESGELSNDAVLRQTVDRMMLDPKIERFLDTFPTQWMQLENALAATPDPEINRYFSLDKQNPASLQMVLEPLLLFDTVFIEDRPLIELISPEFSYQSDFLTDWYTTPLRAPPVDEVRIVEDNRVRNEKLKLLQSSIAAVREELDVLDRARADPIAEKLITVDLSAGQAAWQAEQAKVVAVNVTLSPWHRIGPFGADSFDQAHEKAFFDESDVDLKQTFGDLKWVEAKDLVDGKLHNLSGVSCATYLYRTIHTDSGRDLELSLGSDDSFKIWLNGILVGEKKVIRGAAPDQDKLRVSLTKGDNTILMKVVNGGCGYAFYFKAEPLPLPAPVVAALKIAAGQRNEEQQQTLAAYYLSIAPELVEVRRQLAESRSVVSKRDRQLQDELKKAPKPQEIDKLRQDAQRRFDDQLRAKMRSRAFRRVAITDVRYGGVITNAAMLSMTSGPTRTHPIARGAWVVEVIFNNPPDPPPNDVPPLNEESGRQDLTIREKFAVHRENASCAGCHSKLDPLGFALENFDITGRWRDKYDNGRDVDSSGTLMRKYEFDGIVQFKESIVREDRRFAKAFTAHLLRFALSRELGPADSITINSIVDSLQQGDFKLRSLIREVAQSDVFVNR
jgi:hypothetical protein